LAIDIELDGAIWARRAHHDPLHQLAEQGVGLRAIIGLLASQEGFQVGDLLPVKIPDTRMELYGRRGSYFEFPFQLGPTGLQSG
jgi:hypothetical protein